MLKLKPMRHPLEEFVRRLWFQLVGLGSLERDVGNAKYETRFPVQYCTERSSILAYIYLDVDGPVCLVEEAHP